MEQSRGRGRVSGVSPSLWRRPEESLFPCPVMRWGGWQGAGALAPGVQECLEATMPVVTAEVLGG